MKLNSSLRFALGATIAFAIVPFTVQAKDSDRHTCTDESLQGKFGFTAHGMTLPALGLQAPLTGAFASSGLADFDGLGHFTLTATSSFNGVIQGPATVTGTYAVNSDCSYTSKASNGVTFRAVIVNNGRELLILQTTPGVVIAGLAKKVGGQNNEEYETIREGRKACSAAGFAGNYGFLADGFAGAPTLPNTPFGALAGVGVITVKPDGTFTMMAQRSVGGVLDPAPLPLTGSYTVSSNCTAELTFDVGFHFTATVINDSEAIFIEKDPGTVLTVISKRL
jgi:hypothetical protein